MQPDSGRTEREVGPGTWQLSDRAVGAASHPQDPPRLVSAAQTRAELNRRGQRVTASHRLGPHGCPDEEGSAELC